VTLDPSHPSDNVRNAIAELARTLRPDDPRAQIFFEDRVDQRMRLSSWGRREVLATRTCGAALGGQTSVRLSGPDFLPHGPTDSRTGVTGSSALRGAHEEWVAGLEERIVELATKEAAGHRRPNWMVNLVSFYQEVWVAHPDLRVVHDVRRGCRLELRAQLGDQHPATGVAELVLKRGAHAPIAEAFRDAFDRAEARRSTPIRAPIGTTAAVFGPGTAGVVVHELIGHALEGDVVARGRSWVRSQPFPEAERSVTVVDDPRRGRGAWSIDDEGIAARETTLIEGGRPVGVLLDRSSGRQLGSASTGHGRRASYLENVHPRMGCTFIDAGDDDPAEITRSTRAGVFIRRLASGHTDPSTGRATFVVTDADRIVAGRLAGPLDVFVLELDGGRAWGSIDRVARDLTFDTCVGSCVRDGQPLAVSVGAPTIRIGVVTVRS
jgi:predicted Zn-dependent protease